MRYPRPSPTERSYPRGLYELAYPKPPTEFQTNLIFAILLGAYEIAFAIRVRHYMTGKEYYIYITCNPAKTVFYTGVTNDLAQRIIEHYLNRGKKKTFAGRYFCYELLYWESFGYILDAIAREKEIKGWSRAKKLKLIKAANWALDFLNASIIVPWPPKDAHGRWEN